MIRNTKKCLFVACLYGLAHLLTFGTLANAQNTQNTPTSFQASRPVEILMAKPAQTGSSESLALFEQAKRYHDGDKVAQDLVKARKLYLLAAQKGSNDAKVNLGYLYFMGEGVAQSYDEARKWYLSAAQNGSKDAQLNLAMIYQNGFGVFKNETKAQYWRTYEQSRQITKKPVVRPITPVAKKPTIEIKTVVPQPKTSLVIAKQDVKRDVQPTKSIKPQPNISKTASVSKINELKPDIDYKVGRVTKLAEINSAASINAIEPNTAISQNESENHKLEDVEISNTHRVANTIDQVQILTTSAQDGLVETKAPSTLSNGKSYRSSPTGTLRKRTRLGGASNQVLPQWISNLIACIMLISVMFTCVWFIIQYSKIGNQKKAHVFARAFYAHHRDRLRINYLHYPEKHRRIDNIDDSWAAVLCVLMVKFAQSKKDEESLVGIQSRVIIQALGESPFKAKQSVFPFVKSTQQRIFEDIEAHECNFNGTVEREDEKLMKEMLQAPDIEKSTEVKLISVDNENQTSILKETPSPYIEDL